MGVLRKVTGLENLVTQVEDAKSTLRLLEEEILKLPCDPTNPDDVERSVRQAHALVDEKMAGYGNNAIVMTQVRDFKRRIPSLIAPKGV